MSALVAVADVSADDEALKARWTSAIDGLRTLYSASPVGTARERDLLLGVARDRELVAAMREVVRSADDLEPTWVAVFIAEGSRESGAVVERFGATYFRDAPDWLETFAPFRDAARHQRVRAKGPSVITRSGDTRPMDVDAFWALVDAASASSDPAEALRDLLGELPPKRVAEFDRHFCAAMRRAHRHDLWDAAYLMHGGCSDDGFHDFRAALIGRGRAVFERVLRDPDSLAEHPDVTGDEALPTVASFVYSEQTGRALRPRNTARARPIGKPCDLGDPTVLRARFPRVFAVAQEREGSAARASKRSRAR